MPKDKELKAALFAKKHGMYDKVVIDPNTGKLDVPDDYYESTLGDVGLTLDQVKKLQKHDAMFLAADNLVSGEKAAEVFSSNEEIKSITSQYKAGNVTNTTVFNVGSGINTPITTTIETTVSANDSELRKVHKHLRALFDGINS